MSRSARKKIEYRRTLVTKDCVSIRSTFSWDWDFLSIANGAGYADATVSKQPQQYCTHNIRRLAGYDWTVIPAQYPGRVTYKRRQLATKPRWYSQLLPENLAWQHFWVLWNKILADCRQGERAWHLFDPTQPCCCQEPIPSICSQKKGHRDRTDCGAGWGTMYNTLPIKKLTGLMG